MKQEPNPVEDNVNLFKKRKLKDNDEEVMEEWVNLDWGRTHPLRKSKQAEIIKMAIKTGISADEDNDD